MPHIDGPELEGKVAAVTGAGSGIGKATAVTFANEGAVVAIIDRDADAAHAVAAAIDGHAFALDVRDGAAVAGAFDEIAERLGGLHVLVNNAGVGDLRPLHTIDDKVWHRVVDVNLTGTQNAMRAAIPIMLAGEGGAVVNVASVSGITPTRNEAAYSAAKAGVIALTKSGALEYGPSVRVTCVAPGYVRTPLTAMFDQYPDAFDEIAAGLPARRMGEPDEIAQVILFLACERSSYVTGHTIVADGGVSLPQAGTDAALAKLFERLQD
jgi:NAD(P)-dependent dehydrogenase (short-subunit alcohol dehydrogenase family)